MTFSPSLIVDIILGVICICVIVKYSIKGFLKTILDLARLAVSVILAIMFRGVVAKLLNDLFMTNVIHDWVYNSLTSKVAGLSETVDFVRIYEDAPQFYSEVLALFDLDFAEFEMAIKELSAENVENVTNMIANPLATMLSTLIAVIAIFIVSMIVLFFVVKLLNNLTKIKLVNVINRILGVALGIILASVIVWLLSILLQVLVETIGPMYPDIFNSSLTEDSMIINILKEAGLLGVLDGLKTQITESIR
ncbi:MAG: CvpA family protein [Clostridia bacterium]|nr:CvpA family protein [Clostridia bacterium]